MSNQSKQYNHYDIEIKVSEGRADGTALYTLTHLPSGFMIQGRGHTFTCKFKYAMINILGQLVIQFWEDLGEEQTREYCEECHRIKDKIICT